MDEWHHDVRLADPYWRDFAEPLSRLKQGAFPDDGQLSQLLPDSARSRPGHPIRFVASRQIPGVNYELHIHDTGQVSTRENSWHDLFNALAWARFPTLKSAINAAHVQAMASGCEPGRGKRRDALTLFDECGVIIMSTDSDMLGLLAAREWQSVFRLHREDWGRSIHVFIFGHAMLEKFLDPYKSMTANALLVHTPGCVSEMSRDQWLNSLDYALASELDSGTLLESSGDLSPLPLMGIPGWWRSGEQDRDFYGDQSVFRPPPDGFRPAPVISVPLD